jgi:hypothetical protein
MEQLQTQGLKSPKFDAKIKIEPKVDAPKFNNLISSWKESFRRLT